MRWFVGVVCVGVCCLGTWALPRPQARAQGFDKRAKELSRLRAEIEKLEGQLQNERATSSAELKALATQKGELSLLTRKETIRVASLRKERARLLARLKVANSKATQLVPTLLEGITAAEGLVRSNLPFKRPERLAELATIKRGLLARTLSPATATTQLWRFIEDELELCRDSGLFRQAISLDGQRMLADVVRLGMVVLLFRTSDDRYGHAERQPDGTYRFKVASPGPLQEKIKAVFEAMKRQIRSGLFKVPLPPLPARSGGGS